jgi:serine phosphatase RsbU (regulator of sigma subunit)
MPDDASQHMTCMEVWGGNQPADSGVVMAGLDAWVYSKPFGQSDAGGDVYYVSSCATGRITRLLLADVSGHGSHVAQTAVSLRRLMQKYVNFIDQTAFVRSMNRQFTELSDAGTFATAIVSTFFGPTRDLTLCIAGHPPPLIYRAANRQWALLDPRDRGDAFNIPLGIDNQDDWAQFSVRLALGDMMLGYTDCLIESRGPDGEMLGPKGLLEIVAGIEMPDPKHLIPAVLSAVASRAQGNLEADDVTMLLVRSNGTAPAAPFFTRAIAPLRVLKAACSSLFPGAAPAPWPDFRLANIGGAIFSPLSRFWGRKN